MHRSTLQLCSPCKLRSLQRKSLNPRNRVAHERQVAARGLLQGPAHVQVLRAIADAGRGQPGAQRLVRHQRVQHLLASMTGAAQSASEMQNVNALLGFCMHAINQHALRKSPRWSMYAGAQQSSGLQKSSFPATPLNLAQLESWQGSFVGACLLQRVGRAHAEGHARTAHGAGRVTLVRHRVRVHTLRAHVPAWLRG